MGEEIARVKVFIGTYHSQVEEEVNQWIAEAAGRGTKVIQIAACEDHAYHILWVLYEE